MRETAFQRFAELGFPTTHDEEWRFTNVAPIARLVGHALALPIPRRELPSRSPTISRQIRPLRKPRLRRAEHSLLRGRHLHPHPARPIVGSPSRSRYDSPSAVSHPRTLIVVGPDAHCTIVETYSGAGLLLHQRRHRNRRRRRRRGGSLQGAARIRRRLPRRRHVRQPGPQRQFLLALASRSAARWCATKSAPRFRKAPTPPSTACTW